MHVEGGGQLEVVGSIFPPCGFWGWNLGLTAKRLPIHWPPEWAFQSYKLLMDILAISPGGGGRNPMGTGRLVRVSTEIPCFHLPNNFLPALVCLTPESPYTE